MGRERRWLVFGAWCAMYWPAAGFAGAPTGDKGVRFRLVDDYLIVVPVFVNGAGPWNFLLDTGTSSTVIDTELERTLKPPHIGQATVALLTGIRHDQRVQLDEVRVGSWSSAGMAARVAKVDHGRELPPGVRGILGEDFLKRFDILIDFEKHFLYFDEPAPDGERIQFKDAGRYGNSRTVNRLLMEVEFPGTGRGPVVLQLDTAARITELFSTSNVTPLHLANAWEIGSHSSGGVSPDMMPVYVHATIKVGATELNNMLVVQAYDDAESDAVGLLPAAIFRRIYINHAGKFIVLNPGPTKRIPQGDLVEEAEMAQTDE